MTLFEQLLTLPPVSPPHDWGNRPYIARNGYPWTIDTASGKVYCPPCSTTALSGRGITTESVGLRLTVSKKLLGESPVCQHCGRAMIRGIVRPKKSKKNGKAVRQFAAALKWVGGWRDEY